MEDVFDVYEMPYNPVVPVVCMNEKPYQLLGEVRDSWAMRPGDGKKIDSEYARNGTCSIFAFYRNTWRNTPCEHTGTPYSRGFGGRNQISVRCHVSRC